MDCKTRPELRNCPQCRVVKRNNFSRNRLLEELARKIFGEDAVNTVVEDQEKEELEDEDDVPGIGLPTYDDMGFPDYGLDIF